MPLKRSDIIKLLITKLNNNYEGNVNGNEPDDEISDEIIDEITDETEDEISDEDYDDYYDLDYYNEASVIDAIELGELPILTIHTKSFNNEIQTYFAEILIDTFNDIYQHLFEFRYYYAIYRILKGASKRNIKLFHMCCKYTLSDSDNKNLNYENNSDDEDIDSEDNEIDSDEEFFFHEEDDEDRHKNDIRDLCYLNFF